MKTGWFLSPKVNAVDAIVCIFNLRAISQAGRRGFGRICLLEPPTPLGRLPAPAPVPPVISGDQFHLEEIGPEKSPSWRVTHNALRYLLLTFQFRERGGCRFAGGASFALYACVPSRIARGRVADINFNVGAHGLPAELAGHRMERPLDPFVIARDDGQVGFGRLVWLRTALFPIPQRAGSAQVRAFCVPVRVFIHGS